MSEKTIKMQKKEEIYTEQEQLEDFLKSYDSFISLLNEIIIKVPDLTQKAITLRARMDRLKIPNKQRITKNCFGEVEVGNKITKNSYSSGHFQVQL